MRDIYNPQRSLFSQWANHRVGKELQVIDRILNDHPEFLEWVFSDLRGGNATSIKGSKGMTAEQVLRAAIIKQQNRWTYDFLALQCADSQTTQAFVRLNFDQTFKVSCLKKNIAMIRPETWQRINDELVRYAAATGVERGRTIRMDATVVASNIHHPSDSSLLYDCIKSVNRIFRKGRKIAHADLYPKMTAKQAKWLVLGIANQRGNVGRKRKYRVLLRGARDVAKQLPGAIAKLKRIAFGSGDIVELERIQVILPLIIDQTYRRTQRDETVPSDEKIVSIHEPHTSIIVKGQRDTEYGHKVFLTAGKSGMVLDCQLTQGNPADSDFFMELLDRQNEILGRYPRQTSADGGFASQDNVLDAQELGVKDVCFSKHAGLEIDEMTSSPWVFEKLRRFRAGIEGVISVLKRAFGLERATWRGSRGFAAYVHSAIAAYNLTLLARLLPN